MGRGKHTEKITGASLWKNHTHHMFFLMPIQFEVHPHWICCVDTDGRLQLLVYNMLSKHCIVKNIQIEDTEYFP